MENMKGTSNDFRARGDHADQHCRIHVRTHGHPDASGFIALVRDSNLPLLVASTLMRVTVTSDSVRYLACLSA